jgi:hypothetical protein
VRHGTLRSGSEIMSLRNLFDTEPNVFVGNNVFRHERIEKSFYA